MGYDNALVAGKLRRWESYLSGFCLPEWESIPNIGLFMEQVVELLGQYLDYLPPELKEEQFLTPATINNYVRTKLMPQPEKKRYYREHIAYLIMILTLKQTLSMSLIHRLLPADMTGAELEAFYRDYTERHRIAKTEFVAQVRKAGTHLLDREPGGVPPEQLIKICAIESSFERLLAEKLLLLEGKFLTQEDLIDTY